MPALPYCHFLRTALALCALAAMCATSARAWIAPEEGQRIPRRVISESGRANPVTAFCVLPNGEVLAAGDRLSVVRPPFLAAPQTLEGINGVRALAPGRGDRVWVGGNSDFGSMETGSGGERHFTSLRPKLPPPYDGNRNLLGPVLAIAPLDDGAFFATENALLLYDSERVRAWPWDGRATILQPLPGQIWIFVPGRGLLLPTRDGPWPLVAEDFFPAPPLWLLPAATPRPGSSPGIGDGWLLGTAHGAYLRRGDRWEPLAALSAALNGTRISATLSLPGGGAAIATETQGIVLVDTDGQPRGRIDNDALLDDAPVRALAIDSALDLWIGTDNGAVRLTDPARITFFPSPGGRTSAAGRSVAFAAGKIYAASARGVFVLRARGSAESRAALAPLPAAPGNVLTLAAQHDRLLAAGDGGIWEWSGENWSTRHATTGTVNVLLPSKLAADRLYFAVGARVESLAARQLASVRVELNDPVTALAEDAAGDLWIATTAHELLRVPISAVEAGRSLTFAPERGLPAGTKNPTPVRCGDTLVVFTDSTILALNAAGTGFEPIPAFVGLRAVRTEDTEASSAIWLLERTTPDAAPGSFLARIERHADGTWHWTPLLTGSAPSRAERLHVAPDGTVACAYAGPTLFRFGPHALEEMPLPGASRLVAARFQRAKPAKSNQPPAPGTLETLALDAPAVELPNDTQRVRFEFTGSNAHDRFFQTRLNGLETEWSPASATSTREFAGLPAGDYTFNVRTVDLAGRTGAIATYRFSKAAVWYLRWPAWVAYLASAIALGAASMRWRLRYVERQNEILNRKVAERTRELVMANSAKMDFLASISHEIRNPLNGIVGLVALLNQAQLAPREREYAQSLAACARSLRRVFDEVLGFAKLEDGRISLQETVFSLPALLQDIGGVFAAEAALRSCRLEVSVEGTPPLLLGDEEKIRTVVSNFVSNALKYAPGAPIQISGSADPADDGQLTINIQVRDHGPGVLPEEQELIFRKFVRGTGTERRREPGAGLGLATCEALARLMHGGVGVESEPGQGATFYLHVTLRPAPDSAVAAPAARPSAVPGTALFDEKLGATALVIEDQPYNQLVARSILERLAYTVTVAANGDEARTLMADRGFTLALIDWDVPGAKGDELATALRATPHGAATTIVAVTAHDADEIRQRCLAAGMDGFLVKPLDEGTLAQTLRLIAEKRPASPPADSPPTTTAEAGPNFRIFSYLGRNHESKIREAAEEYLIQLNVEIDALAAASRDPVRAGSCAHRLRGHAALVHYRPLQDAARRLQEIGSDQRNAPFDIALAEVARAAGDLRSALEDFLSSRSATAE